MCDCERSLLEEIADLKMRRRDVAKSYALALKSSESTHEIDFGKVNQAIIARWSLSGLEWIKKQAWTGAAFIEREGRVKS